MMDMDRYNQIKELVDRKQREFDKAQGARDQLLKQLREFNCRGKEEAEAKLVELRRKADRTREEYEAELKRFEDDYAEHLAEEG